MCEHHDLRVESMDGGDFVVMPVGCKSWFCSKCAVGKGIALRSRLRERLDGTGDWVMLTFTVDQELFEDAQEAFEYLRTNRCVARTMRDLRNESHVGADWFAVIEFQENGWPHYHVMVQSEFVPIDRVRKIWGRLSPREEYGRVGMGSVFYSKPEFADADHAACYLTKYLIKEPKTGFPEWVLNHKGRIRRYATSHGFWRDTTEVEDVVEVEEEEDEPEREAKSAREVVASCTVKVVFGLIKDDGGFQYLGSLDLTWYEVTSVFGLEGEEKPFLIVADSLSALLALNQHQRQRRILTEVGP